MRLAGVGWGGGGLVDERRGELGYHHAEGGFVDFCGGGGVLEEVREFGNCCTETGGVLGCGVDWDVEDFG